MILKIRTVQNGGWLHVGNISSVLSAAVVFSNSLIKATDAIYLTVYHDEHQGNFSWDLPEEVPGLRHSESTFDPQDAWNVQKQFDSEEKSLDSEKYPHAWMLTVQYLDKTTEYFLFTSEAYLINDQGQTIDRFVRKNL